MSGAPVANLPTSSNRRTFVRRVALFAPVVLALLMNGVPQNRGPANAPAPATSASATTEAAFAQSCPNPEFPTDTPTAMDSEPCSIAGSGGAETWQNEAKNNFCAPDPAEPITLVDMVSLQAQAQQDSSIPFGNASEHPLTPKPGPATDRSHLVALGERRKVVLQGFVKIARQEGAESVNCGKQVPDNPEYHDVHISIVQNAGDAECSGVVTEMIPHHRPVGWNQAAVQAVADAHPAVRMTGQLMFDSSHTPCVNGTAIKNDPARASLWEVHPIYEFDVCTEGSCDSGIGWVPLEAWKKTVKHSENSGSR